MQSSSGRTPGILILTALLAMARVGAGQQATVQPDSDHQIRTTLRRFYFNLDHRDWEALTSDILAAKIVAHRQMPEGIRMLVSNDSASGTGPQTCSRSKPAVEEAVLTYNGDWVEAVVPICTAGLAGADRLRLVRFDNRWRFVYIQLFREPA